MRADELRPRLEGVHAYPVTPFTADLDVDVPGLRANIQFLLEAGHTVFTPLGSSGEFPNLSVGEQRLVIEVFLEELQGKESLLIPGCGSNNTAEAVEQARWSADAGVDGLLVPPPTYYPLTAEAAKAHLMAVNDASDLGILLYYLPDWHHFDLTIPQIVDLLGSVPNIVGLKDAALDIVRIERYLRVLGEKVVCVDGGGEFSFAFTHAAGARAMVSTISNFWPELPLRLYASIKKGGPGAALEIMRDVADFLDFWYDSQSTRMHKRAMDMRGLAAGPVRPPLVDPISPERERRLKALLNEQGLT